MRPIISTRRSRAALLLLSGLALGALSSSPVAHAADFGAKTSGNWSSASTWTPNGGPPGGGDYVFIGSTYPNGAAASATVLLTQNQQAWTVVLGYGAGTSGTLNMGNFNLTVHDELYIGFNGGTGAITRGNGSFDVGGLRLSGYTMVMSGSDKLQDLILRDGSSVTTAATGNGSFGVRVWSGSTFALGSDPQSGGFFSPAIEVSGANSTFDARGHTINTSELSIGWEWVNGFHVPGNNVVQFLNRGDLNVDTLLVANQNLNLTATDRVGQLALSNGSTTLAPGAAVYGLQLSNGATATTTAVGNIVGGGISVQSGSTLTLGADLLSGVQVWGDNSTLNAQFHKITGSLWLGWDGGANVRLLNKGNLALEYLFLGNQSQSFNLTATDQVTYFSLSNASTTFIPAVAVQTLFLQNGARATTSATGNITGSVDVTSSVGVTSGSTLTLGANLNVSGTVDVNGDNSTLDAQGHKITADTLLLGWNGGANVQLLNRGGLAVTNLQVANQNFNLTAADQATNFIIYNGGSNLAAGAVVQNLHVWNGSTATTAAAGNVTGSVDILGSSLTLGADLSVSGSVDVRGDNSTINAQFHKITADALYLGYNGGTNVRLLNKGELAVTSLYVYNQSQNLALGAADRAANLQLWASTASTASTANLNGSVWITNGGTLTLGADLNVTGFIQVDGGYFDDTLNAQGHKITADTLTLGNGGSNGLLLNRGNLDVTNLQVGNQDFNLTATDHVANLYLSYGKTTLGAGVGLQHLSVWDLATATTSSAGNITRSVEVNNVLPGIGSKLTLGADLTVSEYFNARGHTITIDAQGHNITASSLTLNYRPSDPGDPNIRLLNDGAITVGGALSLAGGVQLDLHGGNDTAKSLFLSETSGLKIKSAATGFTLTGTTADDLLFNGTSTLTLELNGKQSGWVFRWANPAGGDHIADLNTLIANGSIVFSVSNGGQYNLVSHDGYTYVIQPVPEPGLILLIAAPIVVGLCLRRRGPKEGTGGVGC